MRRSTGAQVHGGASSRQVSHSCLRAAQEEMLIYSLFYFLFVKSYPPLSIGAAAQASTQIHIHKDKHAKTHIFSRASAHSCAHTHEQVKALAQLNAFTKVMGERPAPPPKRLLASGREKERERLSQWQCTHPRPEAGGVQLGPEFKRFNFSCPRMHGHLRMRLTWSAVLSLSFFA